MQDRFIVEAERWVVGIAIRVPGGFRFFSSDPDFLEIDAKTFSKARNMAREIADIARRRREGDAPRAAPPHRPH